MTIALVAFGFSAFLAFLQPAALPDATSTAATPTAVVPDEDDPASTAVQLRPSDTRMTVPVMIDGAGPFRFIVDSGATRTVISSRLAAMLRLPQAGIVTLNSIGGESQVPSVRIDRLVLGGLPARPIVAPVLGEANLGAAGILGIDALQGKKVVIDLVANRMSVEPADRVGRAAATNEIVVVARRKYGQLVLADAAVAGQGIYAIVDTGSMVTLGNLELQGRLVRRHRVAPQTAEITDVAGQKILASYAPIADIRLGKWHLNNVVIAFSDAHAFERFGLAKKPAMLLGMDMMRAFGRVSIDFKRRTVRLLKRSEANDAPA